MEDRPALVPSVLRVACSCGTVKRVRALDPRAVLTYGGWLAGPAPAWLCPSCVIDLRIGARVRDESNTQSTLALALP